jgi:hypothetical protein
VNDLSWLIYLAGLLGSLKNICIGLTICSVAFMGASLIYGGIERDYSCVGAERYEAGKRVQVKGVKIGVIGAISFLFLAAFLPSQNTVYAIAASEMGETALNTETGGKAVEALNAWLDRQIADKED